MTWATANRSPPGREQDLNRPNTLNAGVPQENPQVTSAAPPSMSGFRVKIVLAFIQTDLLRQGASVLVIEPDDADNTGSASFPESRLVCTTPGDVVEGYRGGRQVAGRWR